MKKMIFKICLITLLVLCSLSLYSTTCMADSSLDDIMNNGNSCLNAGSESSTMIDQNDLKSLSNFFLDCNENEAVTVVSNLFKIVQKILNNGGKNP